MRRISSGQAQQIQAGGCDGTNAVRESDYWSNAATNPNFGVIRFEMLQGGKRKNAIADPSRTNQQPAQAGLLDAPAGFKQRTIHVLDAEMNRLGRLQIAIIDIE